MNTDDFNKSAWKAQLDALFQLAGLQGNFNSNTSAFLAATLNTAAFPGQLIPQGVDPSTLPDSSSTTTKNSEDSHFNQAVLAVADTLPASNTPYFSPSGKKRLNGMQTYLAWVDSGAPLDQAAYRVWQTDKSQADTLQNTLDTQMSAAQTAYNALTAPTQDFYTWLNTSYPNRFQIQTTQTQLQQINARLQGEETRALGPLGLQLEAANTNASMGTVHYPQMYGQYTMLCDAAWEPFYTMDSDKFNQQYDYWARMSADPTAPPAVTQIIDIKNADSVDYSTFGLQETEVEGGLELADPFFFFGEGSYSTREEKQTMYESNNFSTISITITCLGAPKAFTITPGDWYSSDPKTTFPNLINGAPPNLDDDLYPFVTQVIVGYGIGYTIQLDQNTYNEFKSFYSKNTSSQVFGIFDIFFEGGASSSSSTTRSFDEVQLSDNSCTITVLPDKSMIPTMIGVVVARNVADSMALSALPSPQDLLTGDAYKFKPLAENIDTAAMGKMLKSFDGRLDDVQRKAFHGHICRLLTEEPSDEAISKLVNLIEDITQGHVLDDTDEDIEGVFDKVTFNHKCGHSVISIIVESNNKATQYTGKPVDLVPTQSAQSALALLSTLQTEIEKAMAAHQIGPYLQSSRQLHQLVAPVIRQLSSIAGVHVNESSMHGLVKPTAELLTRIAANRQAPPVVALGKWMTGSSMVLYQYGGAGHINRWSATTPVSPTLAAGGYGLCFYDGQGRLLGFNLTTVNVVLQFSDGVRMPVTLTGGNNAYFWFNGASFQNVSVAIDVAGVVPAGGSFQVTYKVFQV